MATKKAEPLVETSVICAIPVDELNGVMPVGTTTRLIFTIRQPAVTPPMEIERIVQARLVVPTDQLRHIGRILLSGRLNPTTGVDELGNELAVH